MMNRGYLGIVRGNWYSRVSDHSFIHLFIHYDFFLNAYYIPSTVLDARDSAVRKEKLKSMHFLEATF